MIVWKRCRSVTTGVAAALAFVAGLAAANPVAAQEASPPDLSGVYWAGPERQEFKFVGDAPELTGKGKEKLQENKALLQEIEASKHDPKDVAKCRLIGMPAIWLEPYPFEIAQRPELVTLLYEYQHAFRLVYMNEPPPDPDDVIQLQTMGYSAGRWDGDTLVIESTGFNDRGVLTGAGMPHGEQLKTTERLRKTAPETLELTVTIDDPEYYKRPWTARTSFTLRPDVERQEFTCGYGVYETRYGTCNAHGVP